jgi:hypothetical protein
MLKTWYLNVLKLLMHTLMGHQYKCRYLKLYGNSAPPRRSTAKGKKPYMAGSQKLNKLLRELSSDDDSEADRSPATTSASNLVLPAKPWLDDFNAYLNSRDYLTMHQTVVQWWGVNGSRYPVWASLARDFLSIMASSVSSERVFSSAGITISKRRNRLKADIVEALQCLKCIIKRDLLFRDTDDPSVATEVMGERQLDVQDGLGWDALVDDLEDDEGCEVDDEINLLSLDELNNKM